MVSERVKKLFEDKLTMKHTKREEYWSRLMAMGSIREIELMEEDIGIIKKEISTAKTEGDKAGEKELKQLLDEKEMDLKPASFIFSSNSSFTLSHRVAQDKGSLILFSMIRLHISRARLGSRVNASSNIFNTSESGLPSFFEI